MLQPEAPSNSLSTVPSSSPRTVNLLTVADSPADCALAFKVLTTAKLAFTYHALATETVCESIQRIPLNSYDAILYHHASADSQLENLLQFLQFLESSPQKHAIILIGEAMLHQAIRPYINELADCINCLNKDHLLQLPDILTQQLAQQELAASDPLLPTVDLSLFPSSSPRIPCGKRSVKSRYGQQQQKLLLTCVQLLNSNLIPNQVLENLLQIIGEHFTVDHIALFRLNDVDMSICQEWPASAPEAFSPEGGQDTNTAAWSDLLNIRRCSAPAQKNPTVIQRHFPTHPDLRVVAQTQGLSHSSFISVPIFIREVFFGSLTLQTRRHRGIFSSEDVDTLNLLAEYVAIALEQRDREEFIEQQVAIRIQELEQENQRIEAANQAKSEFLAHMNHELRTPLTGILGFSHMLLEQVYGPLEDKQIEYVRAISDSGEHLLSLINDLLDISKIEADREELYLETIAVEEICRAAMALVQEVARQGNLTLTLELDPKIDFCIADKRRLKQILVNLLSNAVKFTEVGSVTLKVAHQSELITFSVIDTGIGISPEDQSKLFQPFSQIFSHLSRKHKGTGLGLALSRKLARLFGGDLVFVSEVGQGSCFTLLLPA